MKFKLGDRVKLLESSPFFAHQGHLWASKDGVGEVIEINSGDNPIWIYSGGYENCYGESDLILLEEQKKEQFITKGKPMDLLKDLQEEIGKIEAERDQAISNTNLLASKLTELENDVNFWKTESSYKDSIMKDLNEEINKLKSVTLKKEDFDKLKKELEEANKVVDKLFKKPSKSKKKAGRHNAWDNVIIDEVLYKKLQLSYDKKMPMLLKGPSGTGKSTMVRALANEHGSEVVEFNFNGDTTVEHLLGHKILVNGNMIWEDGPLTDAVRNGKVFIGHELNSSNTEIQFIFNGLLELDSSGNLGKLSVQGNNGEVITPNDKFRFYGTYNPGYLGTKTFGTSLMSRFIGAEVKPLTKDDESALLQVFYPKLVAEINFLVELESQLRDDKNFAYDVSTRDIIQTLMFIEGGFSIEEAIDATIANSCQIDLEIETLNKKVKNLISSIKK